MKTMKTKSLLGSILFGAMAVLAGCSQSDELVTDPTGVGELKSVPVTVTATYGGEGTRVAYAEGTDGDSNPIVNASWEESDKLIVLYDGVQTTLDLDEIDGSDASKATFKGYLTYTTTAPTSTSDLYVFVKHDESVATIDTENKKFQYVDDVLVSQNDGTLASATKLNLYSTTVKYGSGTFECNFEPNVSILKFHIVTTDLRDGNGKVSVLYTLTGDNMGGAKTLIADIVADVTNGNDIYFCVPAGEYTNQTLTVKWGEGDSEKQTRTLTQSVETKVTFEKAKMYSKSQAFSAATKVFLGKVGDILYSDGTFSLPANYDNTKTAIGMIAYVGSEDGAIRGIAIALTDAAAPARSWSDAVTKAAAYNAGTLTGSLAGKSWALPTVNQWQRMLIACGSTGTFVDGNPGGNFPPGNIRTMLGMVREKVSGTTALPGSYYWSSTEGGSGAWDYYFSYQGFYTYYQSHNGGYACACLAF